MDRGGLGIGKSLGSLSCQGLMGPEVDVFKQLISEVAEIVEGGAFDDVLIERAPEAFDLAVGLRPIGLV